MDLLLLAPQLALLALALAIIGLDLAGWRGRVSGAVALAGLALPAVLFLGLRGREEAFFSGALIMDDFTVFFSLIFIVAAALVVLVSLLYTERHIGWPAEFYGILLLTTLGMTLMAAAGDLITVYIALETSSMGLYVLVGFRKRDVASGEASLKYLLLGALASAVLLYGLALLYGLSGTTNLATIAPQVAARAGEPVVLLATVLVLCGFGFKIAAVPFQMWAPDVYQGAPTPVTAFLSVASMASGFAVLLRVLVGALGPVQADWQAIFAALAVVTMTVGNLGAIAQQDIKRMMGYSSIAMAGYLLVGLAVATGGGSSSILFFLLAYTVTNLGAFAAIIAFSNQVGSDQIRDYAGLSGRAPWLALGFAVCLFSLIGIPPLAGFFGKLFIFAEAYNRGLGWLALIALLNSAVSMYYYLRVVKVMYLDGATDETRLRVPPSLGIAVALTAVGVLVIGIGVSPLMNSSVLAASSLFR